MADDERIRTERIGELSDENALLRASLAETRERLASLESRADEDSLTLLPNRRRFLRELDRAIRQADRHATPAALLAIGFDGLDAVNRDHGRFAGDAGLIHAGRVLSGLIRSTDHLARTGGAEFGLILDHLDHNSAIETADRLVRCVADAPLDLGGTLVPLHIVIGVATILPGDRRDDVLSRAARNLALARGWEG